MILLLAPLLFAALVVTTVVVTRWKARRVTLVAPVVARVHTSSPYRTPTRRQPRRGF